MGTYAAGAPVVEERVEYGVVGHQVVRLERFLLLLDTSTLLLDRSPSPSLLYTALLDLPRTLWRHVLSHLPSSLTLLPMLLPSLPLPPTRDLLPLTLWSSRRSSLP